MSFFSHSKPPTNSPSSNNTDNNEEIAKLNEKHPLAEIVRFSIIAILIVLPIRAFIAQPFIVSGASMDDTFHNGQYLIVDQVTYDFNAPARGDIIVFRYPKDPSKFFIKRIIGLPGDTINITNAVVTIKNNQNPDGFILDEPYIKSMAPAPTFNETLADREYFVMGDNRDRSSDSRVWGVLQEERIIGRVLFRLFPVNKVDYLPGKANYDNELATSQS